MDTYSQTSGSHSPPMDDSDYTLDSRLRSFRKHFTDIKPPSALRIGPIKPLSLQPKRSTSFPQSPTPDSNPDYSKPSLDSNSNNNTDTSQPLNSLTTLLPPTSTTTSSNTPDDSINLNTNPSTNATNTLTRADIIRHIQLKKFLEAFVRRRKNLKTELEDRLRLLKQEAKNNRRRRQNVFFYPSSATSSTTAANHGNNSNGDINVNGMLDLQKEQRIDGLVEERIRLAHETYEQQLALLINEFVVVGLREEVLRII
ncbi:hypothetical protein NEUTE1DRAFT_98152 [Neurospora tetrasperma FGSC 2508]|uniref:Uncharacterized protein n=1 Tax=Neurospora tetrasperma (strain FGSC 2508 / ATCC MYA-4615 / P0657) TaxID=510951 RepID=F8MAY0_NEUT8|nr:uncharacterized protein NEUTE1DRAFT_98152 [Neurospora tetrasperma FGSC 2508]EGO60999.1 hypothetical protein NEUTE1DRAFT_98152 [Neurospora tetrasperma FGSC 2508]EGZ74995.1 hypothetical protein NEUTE2DRAFT_58693 [Neurospora tetrasperma FGSC 2509]